MERYDIWCYAEDDNVYPQIPNGQKFTAGEAIVLVLHAKP